MVFELHDHSGNIVKIKVIKQFKIQTLALIALVLTFISFIFTPVVNSIQLKTPEQYPFFYANTLPFTYYIAVIYSALLAIFCRNDCVKLISLLCTAFLVEFTPSLMLVNPWLPDQYPYLSEPVYLVRNSHIAPIHYLHEVPGLGLMFSQFMLITNLEPYMTAKLYPFLTVLMLVLPTFLLSREICGNGAIAPLLFLAVNFAQINTFHRFSFFFMLFSFLLLIMQYKYKEHKPTYIVLYIITFLTATISYPGSILIPSLLLFVPIFINILRKIQQKPLLKKSKRPTLSAKLFDEYMLGLVSLIIFVLWNIYIAINSFKDIAELIYRAFLELTLVEDPLRMITFRHTTGVTTTTVFTYILRTRLIIVAILQGLGLLSLTLRSKKQEGFISMLYSILYLPLIMSYLIYLPTTLNQYYMVRAVLYATLLASLCTSMLWIQQYNNKILRIIIVALIMIGLTLIPITRYASIPYLHPTTQELHAATFVHSNYIGNQLIYYTEYPPYIRVIIGKDPNWEFVQLFLVSDQDFDINILISRRHLTRDGYYVFPKQVNITLNYLIKTLSFTHNAIYMCGYTYLFMKS